MTYNKIEKRLASLANKQLTGAADMDQNSFWQFFNIMLDCIDCADCIVTKYMRNNPDYEPECTQGCGHALRKLCSELK